jgi:hypothetical protein
MVVGFTTTYAISAYHHGCCEFKSRTGRGVQHYVIKFVSDLRQVGGFLRVPGQNHRPVKLYHIMLYTPPRAGFELTTLVVIGTDCIGSCKSNYHTMTITTIQQD